MKRILFILSVVCLCSSCAVHKKIAQQPYKLDSVRVEYRTKEVKVLIPGNTVYLHDTIKVPNTDINTDTITNSNGNLKVKAWIKHNVLGSEAVLKDSSYIFKIDSLQEIINQYRNQQTTVTTEKKVVTAWGWIGIGVLIASVISALIMFFIKK